MVQVVVIAHGIEIRDVGQGADLQTFLGSHCDRKGPAPAPGANNTWLYPKGAGGKATHEVRIVYAMGDFAAALDLADAWVVYEGHSRYGQGPAFGPEGVGHVPDKATFPVNPWGVHYRMGYEATDTECIGDLLEHSVTPAEYDLTAADPVKAFLPGALVAAATAARAQVAKIAAKKIKPSAVCSLAGAWRSMNTCQPARAAVVTARGDKPLDGRHYYAHLASARPQEFLTSVTVGSSDLDTSKLACRLLFMGSCSSKVHFHDALVRRRTAVKSPCTFLLTAQVCSASHAMTFLKQVLLKRRDPTSSSDLKKIVKAINGEHDAGIVGVY